MAEAKKSFARLRKLRDWGEISEKEYKIRHTKLVDQLTDTENDFQGYTQSRRSVPGNIWIDDRPSMDITSVSGQSTLENMRNNPPPDWNEIALERGIKIIWNTCTKNWEKEQINVKLDYSKPLAEGSLRLVYHLWDQSDPYNKYVAKISKDSRDQENKQIYFQDVRTQAIANQLGQLYNERLPPKTVEFIQAYVLVLQDRENVVCGVEKFIPGVYFKYTDNSFWENELHRNTPAAFSHFSYEVSHHEILVCDIQGVGDCYTDPQIHSVGGAAFGKGDRGAAGIRDFLSTHQCNKICEYLNLPNVRRIPIRLGGTIPIQSDLSPESKSCRFEGHKGGVTAPLLKDGSIDDIDWISDLRYETFLNNPSEQEEQVCCCYFNI